MLSPAQVLKLVGGHGVHLGALPSTLAGLYGDRPAFEDENPTPGLPTDAMRSYDDLEYGVARITAAHVAAGRAEGDVVLVGIGNRIDVLLHAFAIARFGGTPALMNPRLKQDEIKAIADATGAKALVVDDDLADRVAAHLAGVEVSRVGELGEWLNAHPDDEVGPREGDPDEAALLICTSGTTGVPKAAALTSHGLLASAGRLTAVPIGNRFGPRKGRDVVAAALPLTHVMGFGVAITALCSGVPVIHIENFDAKVMLDTIEQRKPNAFVGVPTMYADLEAAGASERDLSSIQVWFSAADVMPPDRARRFQKYGATVSVRGVHLGAAAFVDAYGMVELSGAVAIKFYAPSQKIPPVAFILPGMHARAVDEQGQTVGIGKVGELEFKGARVLQEYAGREDGFREDGWFPTGDYGRIFPGGVIQFVGRKKDRLKVGGFSVFPAEVETVLRKYDGVEDIVVVGVPDERKGDRPVALVVAKPDFDADAFLDWARTEVAGYRRPSEVIEVDALPRGGNEKVDRTKATEMAIKRLAG